MLLPNEKNRLRARAAHDVAKKIRLEPRLSKDMRRLLKRMVKDFALTYPTNSGTITPSHHKADVVAALRHQYNRVANAFDSTIQDEISNLPIKKIKSIPAKVKNNVRKKMSSYILAHSEKQAQIIIKTTENDLNEEINKVITAAHESGEHIDSEKIASLVSSNYSKKINGRAMMIAMTETQSLAEKTKKTELEEINDLPDDESIGKFKDVWLSVLDDKTRDWHAEADGQVAANDGTFTVGGEQLKYPGDPDGSAENIINCRCCSVATDL